jgi:hypothetical protein
LAIGSNEIGEEGIEEGGEKGRMDEDWEPNDYDEEEDEVGKGVDWLGDVEEEEEEEEEGEISNPW